MRTSLRTGARFIVIAALLGLSACLVSENPLLNDDNARGKPLTPGAYESCQYEEGNEGDCVPLDISREGALYRFQPLEEDEEPTLVRFRPIGRGGFLAQMWSEDDGGYWYFYADRKQGALRMIMIDCQSLPAALRDGLVSKGDLEVEDDGKTCVAKTLSGAEKAAGAYRGADAIKPDAVMVISKAAAR